MHCNGFHCNARNSFVFKMWAEPREPVFSDVDPCIARKFLAMRGPPSSLQFIEPGAKTQVGLGQLLDNEGSPCIAMKKLLAVACNAESRSGGNAA